MNRAQRIYEIGCIACRKYGWQVPCQVHHLNLGEHAGNKRLGDDHTIGLCPWHHVGEPVAGQTVKGCTLMLGPSMKHEPVRFRQVFGPDWQLLVMENELIRRAEMMNVKALCEECGKPSAEAKVCGDCAGEDDKRERDDSLDGDGDD